MEKKRKLKFSKYKLVLAKVSLKEINYFNLNGTKVPYFKQILWIW